MNQKGAVQVESAVQAAAAVASKATLRDSTTKSNKPTNMKLAIEDHDALPPPEEEEEFSQDEESIQLALDRKHFQDQLKQLEKSPTQAEIDLLVAQYTDDYSDDDDENGEDHHDGHGDGEYASSSVDSDDLDDQGVPKKEEVIFKVLVVGNARCGKTCTIRRYIFDDFCEDYVSTIGVDFQEKTFDYDDHLRINLQLWDIAGQDRFAKMTRAYFREAKGAIIVCDITRENTMDAIMTWKKEIDSCCADLNHGERIPVVLVANKSDLLVNPMGAMDIGVNMQKCVSSTGILEWYRASAKSGEKIDEAFNFLIEKMVHKHRREQEDCSTSGFDSENESTASDPHDVIRLDQMANQPPSAKASGCDCN